MHADELRITSPCTLDIEDIAARNRGQRRFCEHCTKDVLVLSAMTESEAREALTAHAGREVCLSYSMDEDGQVLHRDEAAPRMPTRGPNLVPTGRLGRRRRTPAPLPRRLAALAASVAALSLAALTACAPESASPASETAPEAAPMEAMSLAVDEPAATIAAEGPTIPLQPTELGDSPCDGVEPELMDQPPIDAEPGASPKPHPKKKVHHRAGGKRATVRPPQPVMAGGMALPDDL